MKRSVEHDLLIFANIFHCMSDIFLVGLSVCLSVTLSDCLSVLSVFLVFLTFFFVGGGVGGR